MILDVVNVAQDWQERFDLTGALIECQCLSDVRTCPQMDGPAKQDIDMWYVTYVHKIRTLRTVPAVPVLPDLPADNCRPWSAFGRTKIGAFLSRSRSPRAFFSIGWIACIDGGIKQCCTEAFGEPQPIWLSFIPNDKCRKNVSFHMIFAKSSEKFGGRPDWTSQSGGPTRYITVLGIAGAGDLVTTGSPW